MFVCEELCNLSFEKRSWNQDNNNYRTKTLNRSVHYPSLHCRTIHHRWEFFLCVSCRWEKKKKHHYCYIFSRDDEERRSSSAVTARTFSWPAQPMTKYILLYTFFEHFFCFSSSANMIFSPRYYSYKHILICFWTIILVCCLHIRNKPFIRSIM